MHDCLLNSKPVWPPKVLTGQGRELETAIAVNDLRVPNSKLARHTREHQNALTKHT